MDLLGKYPRFDLRDEGWRIYSRHGEKTPQFVGERASIENSSVTEGCRICGTVVNSVLGADVTVEEGALVKDSVIMDGVRVCRGAEVRYSIVDEKSVITEDKRVGSDRALGGGVSIIAAKSRI